MPTNRPDPKVTPDRTADADATAPPDPTQPGDPSVRTSVLDTRAYPFLSPPTQPDDLGTLGPYRVVKLLGEGGMGFVFRGEDDALRRPVALKVMRPEVAAGENARERFLREGRAAAAVKSDHVITIYQVGEANGVPFLAMEFLAGCTLDDWLKGRGGVAPAAVVKVAKDTLRGLGAAHDRGLIHRDIKPANLWLEAGTGRVKVLDFGLTRGADDVLTREGTLVGTPSYMAPEQAAGRPVDPRADLFSLGVVMYRMAAGKNPFQRGDVWATLTALAVDVPPPAGSVAAGLPAGLGALIDRLVAKNATDRPESARAALAELAEVERAMKGGTAAVPVVNVPVVYAPPAAVPEANPWAAVTEAVTEVERAPVPAAPRPEPAVPRPERRQSLVPLVAGVVGLAVVAAGAVGLALLIRGEPEVTKSTPPEEKGARPAPAPKPPEELLVPAAGPAVKAGPSPFDALDPAKIPATERVAWLPKETVAVLGGHRGDPRRWEWGGPIVFSPNGKWFATATRGMSTYDGAILHDAATLDVLWSNPRGGPIAFSPDGKWLACGVPNPLGNSFGVELIDLTGPEPRLAKSLWTGDINGTHSILFLADGKTLLTATGHGDLRAWDYSGQDVKLVQTLRRDSDAQGRRISRLLLSADGRRAVDLEGRADKGYFLGVWDTSNGIKELHRIKALAGEVNAALTPSGDRLVVLRWVSPAEQALEVWRLDEGEPARTYSTSLGAQYHGVGPVTADGKHVFLGGASAVMMELGHAGAKKAREMGPWLVAATPDLSRFVKTGGYRFHVVDGDGKGVAAGGDRVCGPDFVPAAAGGRVFTFHPKSRTWSVKDGALVAAVVEGGDELSASQMSGTLPAPDGRTLAGVGGDLILRAFAVGPSGGRISSRVSRDALGSPASVIRFAWHPDGRRVITAAPDGAVYLWDVTTDPPVRSAGLPAVTTPDRAGGLHLAVAPAGDVVAACHPGELGGGVTLRRLDPPKASARVLAGVPDEYAASSQFLPDGRSLLVAFRKDNEPSRVRRYDLSKREAVPELVWEGISPRSAGGEGVHVNQLSRDGTKLLGYTNTRLYVVELSTRAELLSVDLGEQIPSPPNAQVRWADDGRHVLLGQHGCVYVLRVPDRPVPKP